MAFNIPGLPFKLTAQDMGGFDLGKAINTGIQNAYAPRMNRAKIDQMKSSAQKNLMMSQLFQSIMNGGDLGNFGGGNNMQAAALKAITGIDPYLMSPQQEQDLKLQSANRQLANKKNLETGGANVVRESLQNKVSLPEEYVSMGGHFNMLKDIISSKFGDKKAEERLTQAATANKLVPEYAASQLAAIGQQRPGVAATQHQTGAIMQGWPHFAQKIIENLPGKIQKEAERRHNETVKSVSKGRAQYYSSGGQKKASSPKTSSSKRFKWSDITHTAEQRGIDENEVIDKLAKQMGLGVDEFMNLVESPETR